MTTTETAKFVTIGQGRAIHVAFTFTFSDGQTRLGAKCDQTGFARAGGGRRVRVAHEATAATCKACVR